MHSVNRRRIFNYTLLAFAFTLPISSFVAIRIAVLALIVSLFVTEGNYDFAGRWFRRSWDILIYFVVLAIGTIYSDDVSNAFGVLETSIGLLLLSLTFARISYFDDRLRNDLLRTFSVGVFVSAVVCLANAIFRYATGQGSDVFFYYELTNVISSHPTYTAYFIILAITYIMAGYSSGLSRLRAWQMFAVVSFLFLVMLLTGGRTAFVSMLLVVAFFILRFFTDDKKTKNAHLVAISVAMLLLMLATSQYGDRFMTAEANDSWERFDLWKSAVNANDSFVFGVGTGDYRSELNNYYHQHGMDAFEKGSFNAHNEFIHMYFSNGVLGLLAFTLLISHPLYMAVRRGSAMGVLIFFPFIIYAMTEVFLGRLQGVAFYAFIHQTFVSYFDSMQRTAILKA
jgi:hypothetical protein